MLLVPSPPIIIPQPPQFHYPPTQPSLPLKQQPYTVILLNSNPPTIITHKQIPHKLYIQPLTHHFIPP
ncbi:carbamoyl phosphate synthase preATP-grasp domain-containing protein, partial [Staphylococcus epidermidis]